ncbi:hypothetical protein [Bacillus haynesii]|uniref:hypothetical protein n=1 Tax=Bacillus haynesii TaxID=1925021 RepID=UPI00228233A4|nr:hypothetical protein [Bacillus haynesii]MCY7817289.1 hypothetical protein [Bacillus haynesii]MCY8569358.1 hypothetical protein [Bacillus haynesii]MCY8664244.1 hypothetical protein [Bacillus haynesii]
MDGLLGKIGNVADIIGIISGISAIIAWINARKHAKNANKTLELVNNYRKVEVFTEINKKLEQIRYSIRDVGTSRATNIQKRYKELETRIGEIIQAIPSKNNDLIEKMREIEKEIRIKGDKNEKLIDQDQYAVLESIDYVMTGLKGLMEELKQEI